ncbi:MAG TPA: glycosyl transferase family 90 [Chryseolinea sp.]|mgnify:CR=1 FL=1|nr:glycosyl transferase family 90 [Chryseolinea sp.]HPM31867.1 glycosyl transferase family 90 [Chryseolinea sp.]
MISLPWKHKNNKLWYYLKGFCREIIPGSMSRSQLNGKLAQLSRFDFEYIRHRVNYYNKLTQKQILSDSSNTLAHLTLPPKLKVYYFDNYEYTRYFDPALKANFLFGDITYIPEEPSIVKSRPIQGGHANSILLKLNKVRHFIYTRDKKNFEDKKNMLIGRAVVKRDHRIRFYEMYFNHPLCNLGQINRWGKNDHWIKDKLTIEQHLDYKFILCLEGNDVASNLKWVMSSNSLAVMPKPKFETWYMEDTLIGNYHYVEIKEDYSDLEERMRYYIAHTDEAQSIIQNANAYVNQFKNKVREDLISLLVLEKYFYKTGQIPLRNHGLYT